MLALTEDYDACSKLSDTMCEERLECARYQVSARLCPTYCYLLYYINCCLFQHVWDLELAQEDDDRPSLTQVNMLNKEDNSLTKA